MDSETDQLEVLLRSRQAAIGTDAFRSRVLRAVADELQAGRTSAPMGGAEVRFWAAAAAVAFIVMNLSTMFATADEFSRRHARDPQAITTEVAAIHQIEAQQERIFK